MRPTLRPTHDTPAKSGTTPIATGDLTWTTTTGRRGRAYVTVTATAPNGDTLTTRLTYRDPSAAATHIQRALHHFTTHLLAAWDRPTGTYHRICATRGHYLTLTRNGPRVHLSRHRLHGARAALNGWTAMSVHSSPAPAASH